MVGEVATIALAGAVVALVGGLLLVVLWARSAMDRREAAEARAAAIDDMRHAAERARDQALAEGSRVTGELELARGRLSQLERSLASVREEALRDARQRLASGSDADVAAVVDGLLQAVSAADPAEHPTGGGDGAGRPAPVPPAAPAGPRPAGGPAGG